ncbi:hypothetical protein [Streptomyces termitum]|uniref:hypothetical protein n=1 Tax=Streptomyces termitum TaxID=67368 RepID=UPI0033B327C9
MSVWNLQKVRRTAAVVALASMALAVTGCGAEEKPGSGGSGASASSAPKTTPGKAQGTEQGKGQEQDTAETLVAASGPDGFELDIKSAERDPGGFLTIKGDLKNTSDEGRAVPANLRGDETEMRKHGTSLGGATLVDSLGKKRYYVLRDTDGRPLTTTNLGIVQPGESIKVFMQFPSPPESTTEVSFQLPTFEPATLKLS